MNAEVRIYRVSVEEDASKSLEFRCLATREKDSVIGNITMNDAFKTLIEEEDSGSEFSRFPFQIGQEISEDQLIAYAQTPNDLSLKVEKLTDDTHDVIYPVPLTPVVTNAGFDTGNVIIYGENFNIDSKVFVNGEELTSVFGEDASLTVEAPTEPGEYTWEIIVTNGELSSNKFIYDFEIAE